MRNGVMGGSDHGSESPTTIMRRVLAAFQRHGYRPFVVSVTQLERYSKDHDFDLHAAGPWRSVGHIIYEHTKNSSWVLVNFRKSKGSAVGYYLISKDGYFKLDVFRYACHYGTAYLFLDSALATQNADGMAILSPDGEFLHKVIKGVCRRKGMPRRYYERLYEIIDRVDLDGPTLKSLVDCIGADNFEYLVDRIRSRRDFPWQFTRKLDLRLSGFRNRDGWLPLWLIYKEKFFLYFNRLIMPVGIHIRIVVPDGTSWSEVAEKALERLSDLFPRIRILEKPDRNRRRTIYSRSETDASYNETREFLPYRVRFLPMALIQAVEFLTVILPAKIRHVIVLEEGLPCRTGSPAAGSRGRLGTWLAEALRMFSPKPDVVVIFRPATADPRADTAFGPDVLYIDESQSAEKMGEHVVERTVEYLHERTLRRLGIPACERPRQRKGDRLAPGLENG